MTRSTGKALGGLAVAMLLASCATSPEQNGRLPDGHYYITSVDASGAKVAGPTVFDIPYNDQTWFVGAACMNDETARAIVTGDNGTFEFVCIRQ